jgi:hypothetical protein
MATRKKDKEFRLRLAPYRDPITMKLMDTAASGACTHTVRGVDAYAKYGESDGDLAMFVVLDVDGTHVFSCPLERVIECVSEGNLIRKEKLAAVRPLREAM